MIKSLAASLLLALLAACGGGGGGDGPTPPPTVPITNPHAALAGVFESSSAAASTETTVDNLSGTVHVHSDGTVAGNLWHFSQPRGTSTENTQELFTFSGSLSTGEVTYTYELRRGEVLSGQFVWSDSTQLGLGRIEALTSHLNGAPAIGIRFSSTNVPFLVRPITLAKKQLPSVYIGLPLQKLGGWMHFRVQRESDLKNRHLPLAQVMQQVEVHHDLATGAMTGSFGPQCQISGRLYGYDASTGTLRQDWTFSGSGCRVTGTSQMVGQLLGGAVIGTEVAGVMGGQWTVVTLSHPLAVLPGPFGAIAGGYAAGNREQVGELLVHPDGTVTAKATRYSGSDLRDAESGVFYGRLEGPAPPYRAVGEFVVETARADPAAADTLARGTATLELTPTTNGAYGAMAARISSALTPPLAEFVVSRGNAWGLGQPFERITGLYSKGWVTTPGGPECATPACLAGTPMQVQLSANGNLSGTVLENCQLSGRLLAYEEPFQLFVHEISLQGSGCPVAGTGQLLGRVGFSGRASPNLALISSGIFAGQPFALTLVHSTNLP